MNEKKYVGSGKKVGNYDLINFTIAEDKVKDAWFDYNGKKYLRLTIGNKKEADQYGKTHSVWLDEYKPEEKVEQSSKPEPNLPF
jgi:hypothetical protein